jgi:hypothetical protein
MGQRGGVPGRVPMHTWSTDLVELAIRHLALADRTVDGKALEGDLKKGLAELNRAFNARAFGDPALIEPAAARLAAWSDAVLRLLGAVYADSRAARGLLVEMPVRYDVKRLLDYESAREVSWAFALIYGELVGPRGDPRVLGQLGRIDRLVKMRLPAGRDTPMESELTDSLERIKKYDAREFRTLFGELGKLLGPRR